jgi:uncharacterized protein YdeI (YjbR/CyaY-like superfamily)
MAGQDIDALIVPDDLISRLRTVAGAEEWFGAAAPSYRRNALRWLAKAKSVETRDRRLYAITEAAGAKQKLPQL